MQENNRWHVLDTADDVAQVAAEHILRSASNAIAQRGCFKLVLAGGTTPEKIYRILANSQANWQHWHIYYGDERCLPADHPERNSMMAKNSLLDHVSIPTAQIFTIASELGNEQGAALYRCVVEQALPFDLVLLGLGEDGHTASLFPGHIHNLHDTVHAVYQSPKPPAERISISAHALSQTEEVLFLVTGVGKNAMVKQWRAQANIPAASIQCQQGVDIYIDRDANN